MLPAPKVQHVVPIEGFVDENGGGDVSVRDTTATATEGNITFAAPGNYAPRNNCYEYVILGKKWTLGNKIEEMMRRVKILSMLLPGTQDMLQTKDKGAVLYGSCVVPEQVKPIIGMNDECILGEHKLQKDEAGRCAIQLDDRDLLMRFIDDAYKNYDAEKLKIINELKEDIRVLLGNIKSVSDQMPTVSVESQKYSIYLPPLVTYNNELRTYNQNVRNCIAATRNAIAINKQILARIVADIADKRRRINVINQIIAAYSPWGKFPERRDKKGKLKIKKPKKLNMKKIKKFAKGLFRKKHMPPRPVPGQYVTPPIPQTDYGKVADYSCQANGCYVRP